MFLILKKRKNKNKQRGFSLMELIVVMAIFAIVMSIALFNQNKLNNNILITNLAYEIGLSIREAQAYGIGVRTVDTGADTAYQGGYGISFDARQPDKIIVFNDRDGDGLVKVGEEGNSYTIQNQRGNKIVATCIDLPKTADGNDVACDSTHSTGLINIIFKRPNPEAAFLSCVVYNGTASPCKASNGPAYIVVNTPAGDNCRVVVVEPTGQIRVEAADKNHCSNQ